ncbi:hypothetical protein TRFO_41330 [Tritrichomonas foetus]|uniref:EGF-like domain-containing protein n=1 Tax=Tritrichomonas foetus TaxID=1144522 RepID=A0A1J4L559_9EUKA|nr:hypothetical protein TRFO_41330 [Tritrichomonas foetus]|eukprot:OHT17070.1 hypothetical protein TRFO_41330 [Tritrichomonas foetus]
MLFLYLSTIACEFRTYEHQLINHEQPEFGTFEQRFYFDKEPLGDNKVRSLLVYVGGLSALDEEMFKAGPILDIAKRSHSILFGLEHRYFGESKIYSRLSLQNMTYLNTNEVIDDIALFVNYIKNDFCPKSKCRVALVGEGYAGSLCVWAKQQYPNYIDSVWASSSPLILSNEYHAYDMFHTTVLRSYTPKGANALSAHLKKIEDIFNSGNQTEIEKVYKDFNIPESMIPYNFLNAVANLIYDLLDIPEMFDQFFWNFFSDGGDIKYDDLPSKISTILKGINRDISYYDPVWPNDPDNEEMREKRLITFMQCNEVGWIPISPPSGIPSRILQRSINSTSVSQNICWNLFQFRLQSHDYFNDRHGGRSPGVSSVIYTKAVQQYWNEFQFLENELNLDNDNEIISLEFSDLLKSPLDYEFIDDSQQLKDVRNVAIETLSEWLNFNGSCLNGYSILHKCVCNNGWHGKFCDKRSRYDEYNAMMAVSVTVPTILMFFVGVIAWFAFVEPSKNNKFKQTI